MILDITNRNKAHLSFDNMDEVAAMLSVLANILRQHPGTVLGCVQEDSGEQYTSSITFTADFQP